MVFLITFFVTQLLRRFWTDSRDFGTNGQLSTMTRSYQGHFLEFPLRDRSVPEVSLPETNTSKDAFFQKKKKSEEDYLGNRDSEMKKKKRCMEKRRYTFNYVNLVLMTSCPRLQPKF